MDVVIPRQVELFEGDAAPVAHIHREYQWAVVLSPAAKPPGTVAGGCG